MNNRKIVSQKPNIVNAKYKLSTNEMKFVISAIAQIKKEDKEFTKYHISIAELEEKLQIGKNQHTRLKQFAKRLMSKPLVIDRPGKGFLVANWFADIEYVDKEARFEVTISEKLKPYLLDIKGQFLKYNLTNILPLTSSYSIRLYQLLKEYQMATKRTFAVDELQELLQVPKSLKIYADFKRKVIKVAEKELIKNCDIFFEYEEIKKGRKVDKLLFRIKDNKRFLEPARLFEIEENQFKKLIGKKILTISGEQEIAVITPFSDFIKIDFENGGTAKVANIHEIKSNLIKM